MDMNVIFESENIIYVRPSFDLVPQYLEMINDIENVAKFIGERRTLLTEQEEIDYIKDKMDKDATMFSMLEKDTREFIGNIEFFNRVDDEAEWGIVITSKMQNKGYGKEALRRSVEYGFNELDLKRIYLEVYANNPRAIHIYENCGFKEYDRTDVDVFMEILKDECPGT
jgi:diamine N-acetyltransferase